MTIPQLVAHRGYPRHYPENTLIGIEAAVAAGARFVEVDVQLSRDRVPVLFHDRGLRRICGVDGRIRDFTHEELWAMRASEREKFGDRFQNVHLTRLSELGLFLGRHPEVKCFVELKRASLEHFGTDSMLDIVRSALTPVLSQCILISYSLDSLSIARWHGFAELGVVIDHWDECKKKQVADIRPQYLFCDSEGLPRDGNIQIEDSQLVIFEVADPGVALNLAARGADFIETFAIGEMLHGLAQLTPSS